MHYAARYGEVVSAAILQGLRILIPDYEWRAQMVMSEKPPEIFTGKQKGASTMSTMSNFIKTDGIQVK